ncbi:hypothetical protein HDU76_006261 [Blyttiomyces sp. JEL0837]|nr:hypothetical protein HDU76_006261 [Blyttiomyces sp. JEL0837]
MTSTYQLPTHHQPQSMPTPPFSTTNSSLNSGGPTMPPSSTTYKPMGCIVLWDYENLSIPSGMRGDEVVRKLKKLVLNSSHGIPQSQGHYHHTDLPYPAPAPAPPLPSQQQQQQPQVKRSLVSSSSTSQSPPLSSSSSATSRSGSSPPSVIHNRATKVSSQSSTSDLDVNNATTTTTTNCNDYGNPVYNESNIVETRILRDIVAVGSTMNMSSYLRLQLQESGVVMLDCASNKKNAADMSIMGEILKFTFFNKPPFRIYLISSDRDFAKTLHLLDGFGYFVTLIHGPSVTESLRSAAREAYEWRDVLGLNSTSLRSNGYREDYELYPQNDPNPNSNPTPTYTTLQQQKRRNSNPAIAIPTGVHLNVITPNKPLVTTVTSMIPPQVSSSSSSGSPSSGFLPLQKSAGKLGEMNSESEANTGSGNNDRDITPKAATAISALVFGVGPCCGGGGSGSSLNGNGKFSFGGGSPSQGGIPGSEVSGFRRGSLGSPVRTSSGVVGKLVVGGVGAAGGVGVGMGMSGKRRESLDELAAAIPVSPALTFSRSVVGQTRNNINRRGDFVFGGGGFGNGGGGGSVMNGGGSSGSTSDSHVSFPHQSIMISPFTALIDAIDALWESSDGDVNGDDGEGEEYEADDDDDVGIGIGGGNGGGGGGSNVGGGGRRISTSPRRRRKPKIDPELAGAPLSELRKLLDGD